MALATDLLNVNLIITLFALRISPQVAIESESDQKRSNDGSVYKNVWLRWYSLVLISESIVEETSRDSRAGKRTAARWRPLTFAVCLAVIQSRRLIGVFDEVHERWKNKLVNIITIIRNANGERRKNGSYCVSRCIARSPSDSPRPKHSWFAMGWLARIV